MKDQAHVTQASQRHLNDKANKFLGHGCIIQSGDDSWECRPILGYNIHTYSIQKFPDDTYRCNCQGFHKNKYCSHIEAVRIFISRTTPTPEGQKNFAFAT